MGSIQQVWYWRCRRTQTYTNMSMPQSGSESPMKSGRVAKQRSCASDYLVTDNVTAQQLGKKASVGLPRTP